MAAIPLIHYGKLDSVLAYRGGRAVSVSQFLHDVAHLAQSLPDKSHILNLCTDRYMFAVGFAAALLRRQVSLLPPNYAPALVERLRKDYPDMYCLADGEVAFRDIEVVHFPHLPKMDDIERAIPTVPAEQRAALVFTSGSTGQPVPHPKSWGSLCKSAVAEGASLYIEQDSGMAVLGTVPAQHMYGLESSLLLALQNGLALVAERPFYPADIRAQLAALPRPRCLVTTPVHLRTLLAEAVEVPSVDFVLCATAPSPRNWRAKPKRALPPRFTKSTVLPKRARLPAGALRRARPGTCWPGLSCVRMNRVTVYAAGMWKSKRR